MGQCRLKERMKRLSHIYCFFSLASYALFIDTARMQPAQIEALFSAIDLSLSFSCHSRGHGILHVLNRISDWRAFNHCPIQAGTAVNFFFFVCRVPYCREEYLSGMSPRSCLDGMPYILYACLVRVFSFPSYPVLLASMGFAFRRVRCIPTNCSRRRINRVVYSL